MGPAAQFYMFCGDFTHLSVLKFRNFLLSPFMVRMVCVSCSRDREIYSFLEWSVRVKYHNYHEERPFRA